MMDGRCNGHGGAHVQRRDPESFDRVTDQYDRFRPGYPPPVMTALTEAAAIHEGSQLLEIAPGSGQLTLDLTVRGTRLVAVEMGPRLADLAREKLRTFPLATLEVSRFETWPLPPDPFDVVVCANALSAPGDIPPGYLELDEHPAWGVVRRRRLVIDRPFTTETWMGLLATDSLVNSLTPEARSVFLSDMASLIDGRYSGKIVRRFLYEIITATKVGG